MMQIFKSKEQMQKEKQEAEKNEPPAIIMHFIKEQKKINTFVLENKLDVGVSDEISNTDILIKMAEKYMSLRDIFLGE